MVRARNQGPVYSSHSVCRRYRDLAETLEDLSKLLNDLSRATVSVGLGMNMANTKIMPNAHVVPNPGESIMIEVVDEYDYSRQIV